MLDQVKSAIIYDEQTKSLETTLKIASGQSLWSLCNLSVNDKFNAVYIYMFLFVLNMSGT